MMHDVEKYIFSEKDKLKCNEFHFFCEKSINCFCFLIEKYAFEKARINSIGREFQIVFKKNKIEVKIIYEMGTLPLLSVYKGVDEIVIDRVTNNYRQNLNDYPLHKKMYEVMNRDNVGVKEYIRSIGKIWKENKDEIISEIESHIEKLSEVLKNNMKILSEQ